MFLLRNTHFAATTMSQATPELKFLFHSADDAAVASIIQLSNSIFCPESGTRYASLEEWKRRLSDPASSIIYLVPQPNNPSVSSGDDQSPTPPVAFLFAHPRLHPEPLRDGSSQSLHIWLAGVLEECRGRSYLDTMVNALGDLERRRLGSESSPMPTLTVCTAPSRFPSMWSWLRARTRWVVEKDLEGGKVLLSFTGRNHIQ